MDFKFTPEQEALREEFDAFFKELMKEAPAGWTGSLEDRTTEEGLEFHKKAARKLGEKGWLVRAWPKEYGGRDAPIIEQLIFSDVAGSYGSPGIDVFGIEMLGPTLLAVGTEEQKREHLIPIARGERMWCQLWSEPGAGSDLSSLTSTAKREGEEYVLDGEKIWVSAAHRADWGFGLFRTDPTQKGSRGLSYLLVDMKTPGITVRPLYHMGGVHLFNEVRFENVRVPVRNRVGEENRGWWVTRATMNFERSGLPLISRSQASLAQLVDFCKAERRDGETLAENPIVRQKLARLAVEIEVGRALSYRVAWTQEKEGLIRATAIASAAKVYGSELQQRMAYTALEILGLPGLIKSGSRFAPISGVFEGLYQYAPGSNIAAGTSEVQRNLIAVMALGLPRSWDEVFKRKTD